MPTGFEVIGDDFNVVVNATWFNYELVDVQSQVSSFTSVGNFTFNGFVFETDDVTSLVFIKCESEFSIWSAGWRNGKRITAVATGITGIPIKMYLFKPQAPTASRSGIQLFNEFGALVFDGLSKFARIAGSMPAEGSGKYSLTSSREYAVMAPCFFGTVMTSTREGTGGGTGGSRWTIVTTLSGPKYQCQSDGIRYLGSRVYAVSEEPSWTQVGSSSYNYQGQNLVVADVKGY
ncbi:hypothetical protein SJI00_07495 [Pseudomonas sp. RP23018S]|uniref:hypothetical protein n=1 Tax=Pseudomonas sp. RP23018S TaxID=3096037 RepID=UPI002ACAA83F|nr:hypothetical protein [Pseudomonas sp. RP23018S]MDZ5602614.1 hypothetical protein [Pseudomonas sp. RP23018S]